MLKEFHFFNILLKNDDNIFDRLSTAGRAKYSGSLHFLRPEA